MDKTSLTAKKCNTDITYPLKIPKIKPKVLSTDPNPEYVTALFIAFPIFIIIKREIIYIKIPKPISAINFDSIYSLNPRI